MLRTYLKLSFRNLLKNKLFSFINITGLAIGIAIALLLFLYISNETEFDKHQSNTNQIYRLICNASTNNTNESWGCSPNIAGPTFKEEIPDIKQQVRLVRHNFGDPANVKFDDKKFFENNLYWVDQSITDIFDFKFLKGNKNNALNKPNKAMISESVAKKYFGTKDPIGQTITVDNQILCEVSAVYQDLPNNSSLDAEIIGSITSVDWMNKNLVWSNASFETYFLLDKKAQVEVVEKKINEITKQKIPLEERWFTFSLQPFHQVHLYSENIQNTYIKNTGDKNQVTIVGILVLIILIVASINYMNLATARAQQRFKEVGICKTIGAKRSVLVKRFYIETILLVLFAILVALILLWVAIPYFNQIVETNITIYNLNNKKVLLTSLCTLILIVGISGSYPALYLSSFNPINLFNPNYKTAKFSNKFRQSLVVVQFSVAIILIFCTIIFYKQLSFLQTKKLGFDPKQVISISTSGAESKEQLVSLINEMNNLPFVESVCRSQTYPGKEGSGRNIYKKDNANEVKDITTCRAGSEILNVLDIKLIAGKPYTELKNSSDTNFQVILNKTAIKFIGFTPEEAIGKKIQLIGSSDEIVGVVEDFNFETLHQPVGAYAFHNAPTEGRPHMLLKVKGEFSADKLEKVKSIFDKVLPNAAFEHLLLNQYINSLYKKESQTTAIGVFFSGLTIFLACLGLFGLSAYMIELRIKEIGIRKVLGASNLNLVRILSQKFVFLVIIASIISFPISYWLMKNWLTNFPFHIDIGINIYTITLATILFTSVLTVAFQAVKAAISNPIKNLRTE